MTTYVFNDNELASLKDKTVIVIGCATGIGRSTSLLAHKHGAKLALGDWNESLGGQLAAELGQRVLFRKSDVSVWTDVVSLFEDAWKQFGRIDAVVSNAGVNNEDFLSSVIDSSTGILSPPDLKPLEINLMGMIYAVKCAVHYFDRQPDARYQIIMTGSAASFLDTPPLYLYCTAKAGIVGLMRGLRSQLIKKNITVNVVCPWLTVTPMLLPEMLSVWDGLPSNQPEGVARALLMPICRQDINGKAFFVAGNEITDFEDTLAATQGQWMGEHLSRNISEGQRRLLH
ncbi:hypothetical protein PFICI_07597 [Pestalotiopsis fici W106-1]|uniref:NAD(P)-binding protein n=1 Tax=Pestalotiopsis fici (strain W106-1 / CGMCC3.15140) TaxID=1229662 RepID=W3X1Q5_PESFW|nr:uncharacterized protein PFICI_07597 [Pestalotiopsis fici W106-1]ETS80068.1 hypothetical protein PFICI_07597 [Pestalotiopsis fici W106-1]